MINEKLMNRLLEGFESVVKDAGVKCLRVTDRDEFLRRIYENEFLKGMKEQLTSCIARANEMQAGLAERGRREIAVLLDASELGSDYATQAEGLLYEYCREK